MKKYNRGFTLVELLVVIAIIGILSGIVLASVNTARAKANDAKVKGQIANIRSAAESYNIDHGDYGGATTSGSCTTGGTGIMFTDTSSGLSKLTTSTNYPTGTTLVCNSDGTNYAVQGNLSGTGNYWCVDSTGASKKESGGLGIATVCS